MSSRSVPYLVCLKEEPAPKTLVLSRLPLNSDFLQRLRPTKVLDLTHVKGGFPKLRELTANCPCDQPMKVRIDKYDILVNYGRLLTENVVPVGFWRSVVRAVFLCKMRDTAPFRDCCGVRVCDRGARETRCNPSWIQIFKIIGLFLLVVLIPMPYYVRLLVFYMYEHDEVMTRKAAMARLGLRESFENSLVHYLTPTHALFLTCYALYSVSALALAYWTRRGDEGRVRKIVTGAFKDLQNLSWIKVLQLAVRNIIWPFRRFGLLGVLIALVYLPIVLPLTLLIYACYALPTVYVTVRMFIYARRAFLHKVSKKPGVWRYKVSHTVDTNLFRFLVETHFPDPPEIKRQVSGRGGLDEPCGVADPEDCERSHRSFRPPPQPPRPTSTSVSGSSTIVEEQSCGESPLKTLACLAVSLLCMLTLLGCLIVVSECIGCLVEMTVFTLMGIIVNAGALLKYVSLVILIVVYSYDCFNNVEKKYLKLNKALFAEVKNRIRDLDKVTSLPSSLQENRGFKSQEQSEQGPHEAPDELADRPHRQWRINDLTLFVDSEDMPRIPRRLFDEVCKIRVAGVPGPVYRGLLLGVVQFLKIAVFISFVFIVVLSFGDVYKVSSTNQMLATLAGGFLPVILRQFMEPERPDIEIGTVGFKTRLDETIKSFWQYWPIHDLQFSRVPDEEPTKEADCAPQEPISYVSNAEQQNHQVSASERASAGVMLTQCNIMAGDDSNYYGIQGMYESSYVPHYTPTMPQRTYEPRVLPPERNSVKINQCKVQAGNLMDPDQKDGFGHRNESQRGFRSHESRLEEKEKNGSKTELQPLTNEGAGMVSTDVFTVGTAGGDEIDGNGGTVVDILVLLPQLQENEWPLEWSNYDGRSIADRDRTSQPTVKL